MVEMTMTYRGELSTKASHGPSGATLTTDAPTDNGGLGRAFSPTDLLATSLGTCALTTMGLAAARDGFSIDGAAATVHKEMTATGPRRVQRLTVHYTLPAGLTAAQTESMKRAAAACPVAKSLHPDVEVVSEFAVGE